jgi:hypothetical protein
LALGVRRLGVPGTHTMNYCACGSLRGDTKATSRSSREEMRTWPQTTERSFVPPRILCIVGVIPARLVLSKDMHFKGDVVICNRTTDQIVVNQEELEDKNFTLCFESRYVNLY